MRIILRDDGSKDDTINILADYESTHSNIIIIRDANCGAEESFNRDTYESESADANAARGKVAKILSCMKKDKAGDILAAMNSTLAAKLTLLIYPKEN